MFGVSDLYDGWVFKSLRIWKINLMERRNPQIGKGEGEGRTEKNIKGRR